MKAKRTSAYLKTPVLHFWHQLNFLSCHPYQKGEKHKKGGIKLSEQILTKEMEIANINKLQNEYVDELIEKIFSTKMGEYAMKSINFTSPTGTGKTKMMSKLINKLPDCFFIVTTLSRGHLYKQIETSLKKDCKYNNYVVYGMMSLTKHSILKDDDIINLLPSDKKIIWLRDEGHINTNKWTPILESRCDKIVNFSATNKEAGGIICNFTHTMMLRTVHQQEGTIQDAIIKLMEVKDAHRSISGYNPCAIFRVVNSVLCDEIERVANIYKLKTISIVDNDNYDMQELCEDDNAYDIIINKQKIIEGIDIRRAHVLWIENEPNNPATTIQIIGRCRRNALLWRDDIDILNVKNRKLLNYTRQCFVFYNVKGMKLDKDENGELATAFCPYISVERLKPNSTVYVRNGQMENGLYIEELKGNTGFFDIVVDKRTGFNIVNHKPFYEINKEQIKIPSSYKQVMAEKVSNHDFYKNLREDIMEFVPKMILPQNASALPSTEFEFTNFIIKRISPELIFVRKIEPSVLPNGRFDKKEFHVSINDIDGSCSDGDAKTIINKFILQISNYKTKYVTIPVTTLPLSSDNNLHVFARYHKMRLFCPNKHYQVTNNSLLAILGIDNFAMIKDKDKGCIIWYPEKSITSKIDKDTKFNRYISEIYKDTIDDVQSQLFTGKNNFPLPKRLNSCLGYCVEYYAKFLIFGPDYLNPHIEKAKEEFLKEKTSIFQNIEDIKEAMLTEQEKKSIILRACILKYKELIDSAFSSGATRYVSVSLKTLISDSAEEFVNTVYDLAIKAANFIQTNVDVNDAIAINPILSTEYITGLADIMSKNTIVDIKCTNYIDEKMVKQVLGYYFLSQYRNDVDIQNVIIYDATSGKHVNVFKTEYEKYLPKDFYEYEIDFDEEFKDRDIEQDHGDENIKDYNFNTINQENQCTKQMEEILLTNTSLPNKIVRALTHKGYKTLNEIYGLRRKDILEIRHIGKKECKKIFIEFTKYKLTVKNKDVDTLIDNCSHAYSDVDYDKPNIGNNESNTQQEIRELFKMLDDLIDE